MKDINKFRGCLVGGAVGDALGYAVEFLDARTIFQKYGEGGITEYELENGVALISDDTQMTLFTANGLLLGKTRRMTGGFGSEIGCVHGAYKDWYRTQVRITEKDAYNYTWLINIPELHARRAPGNTCLSAMEQDRYGATEYPINDSKGCGGVMRVAPIGLYLEATSHRSKNDIAMFGAEVAALTHGHELGYIPAAMLTYIVNLVSQNEDIYLYDAVHQSMVAMEECFPESEYLGVLSRLVQQAMEESCEDKNDLLVIENLGEGWIAEETLAIAIYCSLKYSDDFEKAVVASVNHSGDSDSTGSVTGNIMGAYLGLKGIPQKYIDNLELKDTIVEIADDLFNDCKISEYGSYRDDVWKHKYIYNDYGIPTEEEATTSSSLPPICPQKSEKA